MCTPHHNDTSQYKVDMPVYICNEMYKPSYRNSVSVWPHLFCGANHEKRRGEQLKWSLAFRLYSGSFSWTRTSSYSPLGRVCFCV